MTLRVGILVLLAGFMAIASPLLAGQPTERLMEQVRHELAMLPYYSVFDHLSYEVSGDGEDTTVVLRGYVNRPTLKRQAEAVVQRIEDVSVVVNNIEVLPLSSFDDRIRIGVLRAIYSQPALQKYAAGVDPAIHVIVKNGDVFLEGVVLNETDRNIANIQANGVFGVFSVTNNLLVNTSLGQRGSQVASPSATNASDRSPMADIRRRGSLG